MPAVAKVPSVIKNGRGPIATFPVDTTTPELFLSCSSDTEKSLLSAVDAAQTRT